MAKRQIKKVEFDRREVTTCPKCKMAPGHITNTLPWEDDERVRYHICRRCGYRFKSVEVY